MYFWRHWHPFFAVHLLYINIGTYCRIRTYVYRYVLSNTYLRLLLWNIKIDKNDRKSISDNNLLNNNVNTVDLYQISPVILSSFLGIPSEFLGNRWQYYWRHLQKIHCILSVRKQKQHIHLSLKSKSEKKIWKKSKMWPRLNKSPKKKGK